VKRLAFAVITAICAVPAVAADVSGSIAINQPGFYGQVNIGGFPQPSVIYAQPVWIQRPQRQVGIQPMYLRVPPGHERNWRKHCGEYGACGRPVYFVREDWYQREYVPRHGNQGDGDRNKGGGREHGDDHGDDHGRGDGNKGRGN
jgi:hypothetical protein